MAKTIHVRSGALTPSQVKELAKTAAKKRTAHSVKGMTIRHGKIVVSGDKAHFVESKS